MAALEERAGKESVALLGTGLMGRAMSERLLQKGYRLFVYNRTPEKVQPLVQLGAQAAEHPGAVIEQAPVVLLMLTDAAAIEDVVFSGGRKDFSGKTFIQMGTIAPEESRSFFSRVTAMKGDYLECPVLGSIREARAGNLILMVGGTPEQYLRWKDLLSDIGDRVRRIGDVGQAAAMKLALNQMIASLACAFSASMGIISHNQIDEELFMSILKDSSLHAKMFDKKLPRMKTRDFSHPNFPVKHLRKDVMLILKETRKNKISALHLEGVESIIMQALQNGLGDEDYSAVHNIIFPKKS
ncbi:MAG: NAD(P)-dependent oxidoreductase [Candidatus Omnitrophota bacterium]|jgi:3-hydroxyisobutyrate dehydrogenase